ncbi:TRAP transporter substrate-binding protein [Aurantimonas sp. A2-1-M11]|uniref:TRAP transporter substrate-binding protein n=1 Tax=Aurantimonas sp. A2-1-M11 TaxID=3113712 RepID=UPI002F91E478
MKKTTVAMAMLLSGVLSAQTEAREISLAHLAPINDPRHETLVEFAEQVKDETDGEITIKIFPNSTLGKDREVFEQLQGGLTELALNGEIVSNFYPKWSIINLPYFWRDQDHLNTFLSSDTAQGWVGDMAEQTDVRTLAFLNRNPRILATKETEVNSVEDIQDLKIRVPRIDIYMDTWRAFGVQPTPLSSSEFFLALKTGTVDGMENPIEVMHDWKIYEVAKNLSLTEHMQTRLFLNASTKFLDSLSEEHRKVIVDAAVDAERRHAEKMSQMSGEYVELLREQGMTIVEDPDVSGFKERADEVHEAYRDVIGNDVFEAAKSM